MWGRAFQAEERARAKVLTGTMPGIFKSQQGTGCVGEWSEKERARNGR